MVIDSDFGSSYTIKVSDFFVLFFLPQTRRVPRNKGTAGPGPAYALPSMLSTRKDYNSAAVSSSFHSPIAVQREKGSLAPAPNSYNVSVCH